MRSLLLSITSLCRAARKKQKAQDTNLQIDLSHSIATLTSALEPLFWHTQHMCLLALPSVERKT